MILLNLDYIIRLLSDKANVDLIAEQAVAVANGDKSQSLVKAAKNLLQDIDNKIHNCLKAVESGLFSAALANRLKALEEQKVAAQFQLDEAMLAGNPIKVTKAMVAFYITSFMRSNPEQSKEKVLRAMLKKAVVQKLDDTSYQITAFYNYSSTPGLPNFQVFPINKCSENDSLVNISNSIENTVTSCVIFSFRINKTA